MTNDKAKISIKENSYYVFGNDYTTEFPKVKLGGYISFDNDFNFYQIKSFKKENYEIEGEYIEKYHFGKPVFFIKIQDKEIDPIFFVEDDIICKIEKEENTIQKKFIITDIQLKFDGIYLKLNTFLEENLIKDYKEKKVLIKKSVNVLSLNKKYQNKTLLQKDYYVTEYISKNLKLPNFPFSNLLYKNIYDKLVYIFDKFYGEVKSSKKVITNQYIISPETKNIKIEEDFDFEKYLVFANLINSKGFFYICKSKNCLEIFFENIQKECLFNLILMPKNSSFPLLNVNHKISYSEILSLAKAHKEVKQKSIIEDCSFEFHSKDLQDVNLIHFSAPYDYKIKEIKVCSDNPCRILFLVNGEILEKQHIVTGDQQTFKLKDEINIKKYDKFEIKIQKLKKDAKNMQICFHGTKAVKSVN